MLDSVAVFIDNQLIGIEVDVWQFGDSVIAKFRW